MEYIIALVIVIFLTWKWMPPKGVQSITTKQLKEQLHEDKIWLDVRTPQEYQARHIESFQNIPLGSDFSSLPKDREIVVICQSGLRSIQACKQLKKLGYTNITNVRRGMNDWR